MSTAIILSQDLVLKSGTVPAGTVLGTNADELRSLGAGVKLSPQIAQTLSCQHPFFDYAMVAVPTSHIAGYEQVLRDAMELYRAAR